MKESSTLSTKNAERILHMVKDEIGKDKGTNNQRTTALLLLMQEIMAVYRKAFCEQCPFEIRSYTAHAVRVFRLRFFGDELDPCFDGRAHDLHYLLKYGQDIPRCTTKTVGT